MQEFVYGGKKGNGNRFLTRQACETSCFQSQDICSLPKVIGPCNAHLDQFWYDKERDECFAFTYGGCQGNGNRFDTLPFCQSRCMKGTGGPARRPGSAIAPGVDICSLEMKPGPCTQAIPAWYYEAAQVGLTLVFLSYKILENFMRNAFRMLRKIFLVSRNTSFWILVCETSETKLCYLGLPNKKKSTQTIFSEIIWCPNFALKKFRFEAKLSETETVRFVSLQFHETTKKFHYILLRFAS